MQATFDRCLHPFVWDNEHRLPAIVWFGDSATFATLLVMVAALLESMTRGLEHASHEARSEADKNRAIIESTTEGSIVFDPDDRITGVNNTLAYFVGRPAVEILGFRSLVGFVRRSFEAGELSPGEQTGSSSARWRPLCLNGGRR